jgi:hypothetical protein
MTALSQPHLRLASRSTPGPREGIRLTPSARLQEFLSAAAAVGLDAPTAVGLALERALLLADSEPFGLDVETARRLLRSAAAEARPRRTLGATEATRVRTLSLARPIPAPRVEQALVIPLADGLLARARSYAPAKALQPGAIAEMVSWEVAAILEGRSMAEWAFLQLAGAARSCS